MKSIFSLLVASFISFQTFSQTVVMKEYVSQNWNGSLEDHVNWQGLVMKFKFTFESADKTKNYYLLELTAEDDSGNVLDQFEIADVQIRDTRSFFYMDLVLHRDGQDRTLTAKYDKLQRYLFINGDPHETCTNHNLVDWWRYDAIDSFLLLLKNIVTELDRNIVFHCYLED